MIVEDVNVIWEKRRDNVRATTWEKHGIDYDAIVDGFPKRELVPIGHDQHNKFDDVFSVRRRRVFNKRTATQDGIHYQRSLS